jgi:hypothetical protein
LAISHLPFFDILKLFFPLIVVIKSGKGIKLLYDKRRVAGFH